jgi:glycosyltransferase involved in cell wall biosynthesis
MIQLISLFQSAGWKVTFASAADRSEYMANLQERGIATAGIEVNSSDFDTFVRQVDPSVVLFDRFITEEQFGWRVAHNCPEAMRILDTEDLHFLRRAREKAIKADRNLEQIDLLGEETAKREIASILRSDLTLIISEYEMDLLTDLFEIDNKLLCYLPFMLDATDEEVRENWLSFEERNHFVTIGNFRHPPNWDSILYLKEDIWPLIREKLPEAKLHIYGAYVSRKAKQLHNPEAGFHIKGRAEDAKEVVGKARVCLAPLRFGAGLKGKLVEAMQCGTPSVTTRIGAEGIKGSFKWSGYIADKPEKIAASAVSLYTDKNLWERAQQQAIRIINERFVGTEYGLAVIDRINHIQSSLEEHRLENFVGRMLMHHTTASTEYMSRWIEAKNK